MPDKPKRLPTNLIGNPLLGKQQKAARLGLNAFGNRFELDLPTDDTPIWEKLPRESKLSYERFQYYLEAGATRSIKLTQAHYGLTGSASFWSMARAHHWVERAEAWDKYMGVLLQEELLEARKDMVRRHVQVSAGLLTKLQEKIDNMRWSQIQIKDLPALLKVAVDIERMARGEATSRVDIRTMVESLAKADGLSPDETKQAVSEVERYIKELQAK